MNFKHLLFLFSLLVLSYISAAQKVNTSEAFNLDVLDSVYVKSKLGHEPSFNILDDLFLKQECANLPKSNLRKGKRVYKKLFKQFELNFSLNDIKTKKDFIEHSEKINKIINNNRDLVVENLILLVTNGEDNSGLDCDALSLIHVSINKELGLNCYIKYSRNHAFFGYVINGVDSVDFDPAFGGSKDYNYYKQFAGRELDNTSFYLTPRTLQQALSLTYLNIGIYFLDNKKSNLALKYANKSLETDSLFANAYFLKAVSYMRLGEYYKSCEVANKILTIDSLDHDIQLFRAGTYRQQLKINIENGDTLSAKKNFTKAKEDIEYLLKLNSNNLEASFVLGKLYHDMGKEEEVKKIIADFKNGNRNLTTYYLIYLSKYIGDIDD